MCCIIISPVCTNLCHTEVIKEALKGIPRYKTQHLNSNHQLLRTYPYQPYQVHLGKSNHIHQKFLEKSLQHQAEHSKHHQPPPVKVHQSRKRKTNSYSPLPSSTSHQSPSTRSSNNNFHYHHTHPYPLHQTWQPMEKIHPWWTQSNTSSKWSKSSPDWNSYRGSWKTPTKGHKLYHSK